MTNHISDPFGIVPSYSIGQAVRKVGGDYTFEGTVIGVFFKKSGVVRYAVEDDRGVIHIYSDKVLQGVYS